MSRTIGGSELSWRANRRLSTAFAVAITSGFVAVALGAWPVGVYLFGVGSGVGVAALVLLSTEAAGDER